ncbi:cytochrome c oxidase subunit 3 [Alsobacter sp. SYSU M60028]|uniref:Cytochrome c oxidase subunit 3 n=1 Tax=Alsobacter ponti TaxID=2962936 RepID=A0ABT1LH90_9HYPH|nr:cytochrome c oxidase subunit 3 [Alsobacter ponti]MCP8940875.1 cytochrome c oxidase subunit 3 [Alsobacter ponti]
MRQRPVLDVSSLPDFAFGPRSTMWWGTLGFCALEGTGFAIAAGAYLYLAWLNPQWPLSAPPPALTWSSLFTVLLVASAVPNWLVQRAARRQDLRAVRLWMVVMSLIPLALMALRAAEFPALMVRWDVNAYGSIVWLLLGLHTLHLVTDAADTWVLTALMFTGHVVGKRYSDVSDNAFYWNFVVASWLPIYGLLYWAPRLA